MGILSDVMQEAEQAASNFKGGDATDNALVPTGQTLPATVAKKPGLDSMADNQGISVDEYLRIDKAGFQLGAMKKGYFDSFKATIDMTEVVAIYSARGNSNGSTKFIKSYDGVTTPQGQNFQQALAQLRQQYTKVDGPYETSEIPVTLTEDITCDGVTVEAGTSIGITPSITGVKSFAKFYKKLREAGKQEDEVNVVITHLQRENAAKNVWGVAEFALDEG